MEGQHESPGARPPGPTPPPHAESNFLSVSSASFGRWSRKAPDILCQLTAVGAAALHGNVAFLIAGLASLGLPATSGFVAELTVFLGAFEVWRAATVLAIFGILLAAGYILWTLQRIMFGPPTTRFQHVGDAVTADIAGASLLLAPILIIGIYPAFITDIIREGVLPISNLYS